MIVEILALASAAAAQCPPASEADVQQEFGAWVRAYQAHDLAGTMAIFPVRIPGRARCELVRPQAELRAGICAAGRRRVGSALGRDSRLRENRGRVFAMAGLFDEAGRNKGAARHQPQRRRASPWRRLPLADFPLAHLSGEAVAGSEVAANPRKDRAPGSCRRARATCSLAPPGSGSALRCGAHI